MLGRWPSPARRAIIRKLVCRRASGRMAHRLLDGSGTGCLVASQGNHRRNVASSTSGLDGGSLWSLLTNKLNPGDAALERLRKPRLSIRRPEMAYVAVRPAA